MGLRLQFDSRHRGKCFEVRREIGLSKSDLIVAAKRNLLQGHAVADLYHECGIAAIYHLPGEVSRMAPKQGPNQVSRLMPRLLLEIQNRGQLAAGMTVYRPGHAQLLDTYKDVGTVTEVFCLNQQADAAALMDKYAGPAAIGHVATVIVPGLCHRGCLVAYRRYTQGVVHRGWHTGAGTHGGGW